MSARNSCNRFAAVVLAAGASRRMGQPKALLDLQGRPLLARLLDTIRQTGLIELSVVVTGHQPAAIREALRGIDVTIVHNPDYVEGGMLSSVKAGVRAVADGCDAFFLALLDQPLVTPETLAAMAQAWSRVRSEIVVPAHAGKRGAPNLSFFRSRK